MKMRKIICLAAAAAIASSMVLTSCGGKDEDNGGDTGSAAAAQANPSASASDVADKLRSDIEYVDDLNEISAEMIEKLYGVSADKYTNAKVYVGGVSTAEEIACFDAVDEETAGEIGAACANRVASQIRSFQEYKPEEIDKLANHVLVIKGNSVYLCISNNDDKATEIIG